MNLETRRAVEKRIAKKTIEVMVDAGYYVWVHDGDAVACDITQDKKLALDAMMSVDEEHLHVCKLSDPAASATNKQYTRIGSVFFVYGNDGWDVVNDYSIRLEPQMAIVNAYAEEQERIYG